MGRLSLAVLGVGHRQWTGGRRSRQSGHMVAGASSSRAGKGKHRRGAMTWDIEKGHSLPPGSNISP